MEGELDEYGMVLNLSDVKHIIKQEVTSQLDFAHLNDTWPEFQQTLPTTEFTWPRPFGIVSRPICPSSRFSYLNIQNCGQNI
jgi:hypothetical protein